MFRKSLQILVVGAVVALAAIVAYASLRLSGPGDALAEAEAFLQRGEAARAIDVLNLAERSATIANQPELQQRLWHVRYLANAQLDNSRGALRDVENLLRGGRGDDLALQLERIRLLARAGEGERARLAAKEFLTAHPDHSRGLELAGEACQTVYQPRLRALRESVEREVGRRARIDARAHLLAYVYRPEGDPDTERAAAALAQQFATEPRLSAAWPSLWREAQQVRALVQEGLGFFQQSLDQGGQPVAAFQAIATAYDLAGRIDDLLMACEIQRRNFDHDYVEQAGVLAAWARLRDGLTRDAIAAAERWLPADARQASEPTATSLGAVDQLLQARIFGAWQLRDANELNRTASLVYRLRSAGLDLLQPLWLVSALGRVLRGFQEPERAAADLEKVCQRLLAEPAPLRRPDQAAEYVPLWLDLLQRSGADETTVLAALTRWRTGRPDSAEPALYLAQYLLGLGRTQAAFQALDAAAAVAPEDARLFPLRLEVARRHYRDTEQDGPSLLAACVRTRRSAPEPADPIGFVLCAEAALAVPRGPGATAAAMIAAECARRAIDAFPRALEPRRLELSALLAGGRVADAAHAADRALDGAAADAATLTLAIQAYSAAGQSLRPLLHRALPAVAPNPALGTELLRIALVDTPATATRFVPASLDPATSPAELLLLAAEASARAGDAARAAALLDRASADADPVLRARRAAVFAAWLTAAAKTAADDTLCAAVPERWRTLGLAEAPMAPLFAAAEALAATHPSTARELLDRALANADAEARNGRLFVLAGRLALRQGHLQQCVQHWTAALGFADGQIVAEPLARIALVTGDVGRAERLLQLVTAPTDGALLARLGLVAATATLVTLELVADRADLLAHATLATFGQPSLLDWQAVQDPLLSERLELLSGLREPDLGRWLVERAERLARSSQQRTDRLLLARALVDAGRVAEAAALHAELFAQGLTGPVFWREVAYAGGHDGYVPDPALRTRVVGATADQGIADSPLTLRWSAAQLIEALRAGGATEAADRAQCAQWLAAPQTMGPTAAELDLVEATESPQETCKLLDRLLSRPDIEEPGDLLARFYRLATKIEREGDRAAVGAIARRHLAQFGARGAIVHFLLDQPAAERRDLPPERELLLRHVDLIAGGVDGDDLLAATLDRLVASAGTGAALAAVDDALERHPTAIAVWAARARLRLRAGDGVGGLDELRGVLQHATAPLAELDYLTLAATVRDLAANDAARLAALPPDLLASPAGRYVQGLFALRQGEPAKALAHLADAAPDPDGMHLFAGAMAWLETAADDATTRAVDLLAQLRRDYPRSPLARNAGSFARQLSPRAATAPDSVSNR